MVGLFDHKGLEEIRDLLEDLDGFAESLPGRFNRTQFARLRRQTGSQNDWARNADVTGATIGNWERGVTHPSFYYRLKLKSAAQNFRETIVSNFFRPISKGAIKIDVVATNRRLRHSILRAALTDFEFDTSRTKIVPVPFVGDYGEDLIEEIEADRANLLDSLRRQSEIIIDSIGKDANISDAKFKRYLKSYWDEIGKNKPNPRLLNRLGATISRVTDSDDFRDAVNSWDTEAVDGFNRDHIELMRLYFREALAKAQEIDATEISDVRKLTDGSEFRSVAEIMEAAKTKDN